jgi:hypothetical protein
MFMAIMNCIGCTCFGSLGRVTILFLAVLPKEPRIALTLLRMTTLPISVNIYFDITLSLSELEGSTARQTIERVSQTSFFLYLSCFSTV